MRCLITGANGFLGRRLVQSMAKHGIPAVAAVRQPPTDSNLPSAPDLGPESDWQPLLAGCDTVIHAAARVHVMNEQSADPLHEFRFANTEGTLRLARQAAAAEVRRFLFISTIKVNGETTAVGRPFRNNDPPSPQDPYSQSKHEAEIGLRQLAAKTGMEVVIVRPPLIYGPGVKANFATLMHCLAQGIPLPLGALHDNRRSLIALDNLVDLLRVCLDHPAAANRTLLVSDGDDLSTTALLKRLALALGRQARLLPVPEWLLRSGARLIGRQDICRRLCDSLQVDSSATRDLLSWTPPLTLDEGLRCAAKGISNETAV